ncbi:MAG: LysM peptidoglycan-binding domain-containing protein [Victivallaceae bacterium]|nr:LysM peptidoglycan-binding domain-containing protein [Victivallaceae bacterium]
MKIRMSGMVYSASGLAMLLVLSGCGPEAKDVLAKRDYIPAPKSDVSVPEQSPAMVMQPTGAAESMQPSEETPVVSEIAEVAVVTEVKTEAEPRPITYPKFVGNTSKPVVKPGASAVPQSGAKAGDGVYTVQRGDTLSGIAHRCGVKTADLAAVNGLALDATIRVGQKLKLPAGGKAVAASSSSSSKKSSGSGAKSTSKPAAKTVSRPADGVYVVQKNDSLWTIARKFDTTVAKLCELNGIPANKALQLGQKIKLPGASAAPVEAAVDAATTSSSATASVSGSPSTGSTVGAADATISSGASGVSAVGAESAQPAAIEASTGSVGTETAVAAEPEPRTQVIQRDVEVSALCDLFKWDIEEFKKLNPGLPADGILRRDQVITVPAKK